MNRRRDRSNNEFAIRIYCRKNHALTLNAHHLTRREISDKQHLFANENRWIGIRLRYTAEDSPATHTIIQFELQQTVGFLNGTALKNGSHTDIRLVELINSGQFFDRLGTPVLQRFLLSRSFILRFDALQTVELRLNGCIFYFLEQQRYFTQRMTLMQQVDATEVCPSDGWVET